MKPSPVQSRIPIFLSAIFLCLGENAQSQTKQIHLRTETIATTPALKAAAQVAAKQAQKPAAGLFLVQLEGQLEPAWKKELSSLGVELAFQLHQK